MLPCLRISIADDDRLIVTLDGHPYQETGDQQPHRDDIGSLLTEVLNSAGCAVRVEITESNGTRFTDILLPPPPSQEPPDVSGGPSAALLQSTSGQMAVTGEGFLPGESVSVAVLVAHLRADETGAAALRLPPTLLRHGIDGVALLGDSSGTLARTPIPDQVAS